MNEPTENMILFLGVKEIFEYKIVVLMHSFKDITTEEGKQYILV